MSPYPPSEDTFLLLDNIRCGERVLEIGTGSGVIAVECAKRGSYVVAVDIDPEAVESVKKLAEENGVVVEARISNLFENVSGRFDTIIFNPPYLPGNPERLEDLQWAGGEHGDDVIIKFLEEAWKYLEDDGEIYLVLSSFNRMERIKEFPYVFELIAKEKFAFHEIYLYRLKKA